MMINVIGAANSWTYVIGMISDKTRVRMKVAIIIMYF